MRLAEIEVGGVYAMANYYEREHARIEDRGRLERREWERAWNELSAVRVLEVGVPVSGYKRPGVLVQHLDRGTLEPRRDPTAVRAVQILLPWEEWASRYHEFVEAAREAERDRVERAERERQARQERAARGWMEREFGSARQDIRDVKAVVDGEDPYTPTDDEVRRLVDRRNPDGNPYLNGEWSA